MDEINSSEGCELGKLDYWDNCYHKELNNFYSHGDVGDVWFGEDIVNRIIQWMKKCDIKKDSKLLDVGCGNGMFLIELVNEGFTNLHGVDYSEKAIILAQAIADKQNVSINYSTHDILMHSMPTKFDIIHDKGTYDAITLTENALVNRKLYIRNVYESLNSNGLLILTSCNWTESEIEEQFLQNFERFHVIPTPQFKFGASVGSVVSSCVFKKKMFV